MNCIYEGQSFSVGIMAGDLGGRETAEAAMKTMTAAQLLSPGLNGTYRLTRAGAEAIASLVAVGKPSRARNGAWQSKPPKDKAP